jgi:hypothetical protein
MPPDVNGLSGLLVSFSNSNSAPLICTFNDFRGFFGDLVGEGGGTGEIDKADLMGEICLTSSVVKFVL